MFAKVSKQAHQSMTVTDDARRILAEDLPIALRKKFSIRVAWALADLGDEISSSPIHNQDWKYEQFVRQRLHAVEMAVANVCQDEGTPFTFDRLKSNGQRKLLVKSGRVVLLLEAMKRNLHHPETADYKRELASSRNASRQLILPFPEWDHKVADMSGEVLATLLYGTTGSPFYDHKMGLNRLQLAVPDANYNNWVIKEDLTDLALEGRIASVEFKVERDHASSITWSIQRRANKSEKAKK